LPSAIQGHPACEIILTVIGRCKATWKGSLVTGPKRSISLVTGPTRSLSLKVRMSDSRGYGSCRPPSRGILRARTGHQFRDCDLSHTVEHDPFIKRIERERVCVFERECDLGRA